MEDFILQPDQDMPNNQAHPVRLYRSAAPANAAAIEALFDASGWTDCWRNGIYDYHHYHSTAHEILGIAAGEVTVMLGGESGREVTLQAGDVVILPAGTGHCNIGQSDDLLVIGAYPVGQAPDLCRSRDACPEAVRSIAALLEPPGFSA